MKKLIFIFCIISEFIFAQSSIQWQKSLGGNSSDRGYSTQQTTDGGYIVAGFALTENNGDVWGGPGNGDFWVVKLNPTGDIQWQKAIGGTSTEVAEEIQQTSDGGYILAGRTFSDDVDVSGYHGAADCWVVKLDSIGNILWQRTLGGSSTDEAYSIKQTTDGGYIMAGTTFSTDGDVSTNHIYYDGWLVKLNAVGDIQWQKSIGGRNGAETAYAVCQTTDGGYIIAGETNSSDSGLSDYHGNGDCWVAKFSNTGELEWQKAIGGTGQDAAYSILQTVDGGYAFVGTTSAINSGQVNGVHGGFDIWAVKLNEFGIIEWQRPLGGSNEEHGDDIIQTNDGGYVVLGDTYSSDGDVHGNDGIVDIWVVKLSSTGTLQQQITLGGTDYEQPTSIDQTSDGGFIITGETYSNDGDVSGYHGNGDIWVVKLTGFTVDAQEPISSLNAERLEISPNPAHQAVSLEISTAEPIQFISILDLLGREVQQQSIRENEQVNIAALVPGGYLIKANTRDGRTFTGRLLKQ
jgi:hypothetical protein